MSVYGYSKPFNALVKNQIVPLLFNNTVTGKIEIYTESYGTHPLVIQGAGAGAAVTARGVFGDILRIAEKK